MPGAWFSDNATGTRDVFQKGDALSARAAKVRAANTFPNSSEDFPFHHEPLNIRVLVRGAITENMPAAASERVQWVKKLWMDKAVYGIADADHDWFAPNVQYEYDDDFRKWV